MTEEEAKTKWCPMVRSPGWVVDGAMGNRDHRGGWTGGDCCVASECMMWRWRQVKNPDYVPVHPMLSVAPQHPADQPVPWRDSNTHGYCGLAGRL